MPRKGKGKVHWTDQMTTDLLACKREAICATGSDNPPLKADGKRMGYMDYMHKLWNEKGYGHLNLSKQNLSDQARSVERKQTQILSVVADTIDEERNNTLTNANLAVNEETNVVNSDAVDITNSDTVDNIVDELSDDILNSQQSGTRSKKRV